MTQEELDHDYELFLKSLGARIKRLRRERGLSLRDMVVKHNYHDSQWRRYERGGSINLQSLWKIARVFETTPSVILDGVDENCIPPVDEGKKKQASAKAPAKAQKKKPS